MGTKGGRPRLTHVPDPVRASGARRKPQGRGEVVSQPHAPARRTRACAAPCVRSRADRRLPLPGHAATRGIGAHKHGSRSRRRARAMGEDGLSALRRQTNKGKARREAGLCDGHFQTGVCEPGTVFLTPPRPRQTRSCARRRRSSGSMPWSKRSTASTSMKRCGAGSPGASSSDRTDRWMDGQKAKPGTGPGFAFIRALATTSSPANPKADGQLRLHNPANLLRLQKVWTHSRETPNLHQAHSKMQSLQPRFHQDSIYRPCFQ